MQKLTTHYFEHLTMESKFLNSCIIHQISNLFHISQTCILLRSYYMHAVPESQLLDQRLQHSSLSSLQKIVDASPSRLSGGDAKWKNTGGECSLTLLLTLILTTRSGNAGGDSTRRDRAGRRRARALATVPKVTETARSARGRGTRRNSTGWRLARALAGMAAVTTTMTATLTTACRSGLESARRRGARGLELGVPRVLRSRSETAKASDSAGRSGS